MLISSSENELIKKVKKLKEKKYRDEDGIFVIEGAKIIEEAINEKADIQNIFVCEELTKSNSENLLEIVENICKNNEVIEVTKKVFELLSDVKNPQGILATVKKEKNENIQYDDNFFLLLDGIQDPGNIGTIIRTADSLNIKQIIVSNDTADVYNPKVLRSTMGTIFRVNVIYTNLKDAVEKLKENGITVYATDLKTDKSIYDVDYKKSAVVIGNEANGVSSEVLNSSSRRIKIPMLGKTESLNASVAAGIIMYEAFRKR